MKKVILAILGMCGSGKTVACHYFARQGWSGIYFGGITMEELKKRGMAINPENEKLVREKLRSEYGMSAFAQLSLEKIKEELTKHHLLFIDGLYSFEEYEFLEKEFPGKIILVEIYSDKKIRYHRLTHRNERSLTRAQAMSRDLSEIKNLNKGGPIAFSDYKIENNLQVKDLDQKLEQFLNSIKEN